MDFKREAPKDGFLKMGNGYLAELTHQMQEMGNNCFELKTHYKLFHKVKICKDKCNK